MAQARAVQAIMGQAAAWVTQYKTELSARGLGFTPDDIAAITASATTHPLPPGGATPTPAALAEAEQVRQAALAAEYPEHGFAPDDPRLAADGMPLVAYAVAAKAIGWAGDDTALVDRVLAALGCTHDEWVEAGEHWTPLLRSDMAVATLYGQLFANAGELPVRPA